MGYCKNTPILQPKCQCRLPLIEAYKALIMCMRKQSCGISKHGNEVEMQFVVKAEEDYREIPDTQGSWLKDILGNS